MKTNIKKLYPIITIMALIVIWQIVAVIVNIEIIIPMPNSVLIEMVGFFKSVNFYTQVASSLFRVLCSFALAFLLAFVLSLASNKFTAISNFFYPVVVILRATPTMSIIIICIMWLTPNESPIIIAFLVMFPLLYQTLLTAFQSVDKQLIAMSHVYKVPKKQMLIKLYIPSIAIKIYDSLVSLLAFNVKIVIAGEAIAQTAKSLGGSLFVSKNNLEMAQVFAYTIIAIILSYVLELVFLLIKKVVKAKWI